MFALSNGGRSEILGKQGTSSVWNITNVALTSNVATVTIGRHPFGVDNSVTVDADDNVFDGTYTITAVAQTTISYARTNANITSKAATGTVTAGALQAGTPVQAAGSTNTKGSWVSLGTTSFAYNFLVINAFRAHTAADFTIDIGIGTTGNQFVLVPDVYVSPRKTANELNNTWRLPLHIPSGVEVWARCQSSSANSVLMVTLTGFCCGFGGLRGASRAIALYTPGTSRGVAIDPGATSGTKGSWVQLQVSTAARVQAICGTIGFNNDATRTDAAQILIDLGIGTAGNEFIFAPDIGIATWTTTTDGPANAELPLFPCDIPAGSRLVARAACNDTAAGDRTVDLGLIGLVW